MIEPSNEEATNKKSWISKNSFLFYNILAPIGVLFFAMFVLWLYFQIFPKYQTSQVTASVNGAMPVESRSADSGEPIASRVQSEAEIAASARNVPLSEVTDEGYVWSCTRETPAGSGALPCIFILNPNRITFSYFDSSAQVTFHVRDLAPGETEAEFFGVQVEGSAMEPATGFCEQVANSAYCKASSGSQTVIYTATSDESDH